MNHTISSSSSSSWDLDISIYLISLFGIYHPQILFATWWNYCETNYSEFTMCVWISLLIQAAGYILTCIPPFIFQFIPQLQKYKIQQNKILTWKEQAQCLKMVVCSTHTVTLVPLMIMVYYGTRQFNVPMDYASIPAWYTFIPIMIFCLIVEDTWHYWLHRTLHHPALYKHIHKMHHEYTSPFPWAAEYAHPIELIGLGLGFIVPMFFVCSHLAIFHAWLFVRSMQSVDVHTGYAIYWNPLNLLPFYGGAEFHDYHHRAFHGNYASSFRWWDWVCGTDVDYNKFQANKAKKEIKAE